MEQNSNRSENQINEAGTVIKDSLHEGLASAEKTATRAGEAVESAANRLREHLPEAGEAAETVARKVKQTSAYLQEQGIGGVVEDLEVLIRRYPLQSLLLGLGCGYLLSRARPDRQIG